MRETVPSRQSNYSPFRTSGSLISSTCATICCFVVLFAAIGGLVYSMSYFDNWVRTTAIIVRVEGEGDVEIASYCPIIEFYAVDQDRNITTILDTSCVDDDDMMDEHIVIGETVAIRYDPEEPTEVVDAVIPDVIEVAMICTIVISALCGCGCVLVGAISYKGAKKRDNNNNNSANQTLNGYENNTTTPSSIPMTNFGGNHTRYSDPNAYGNGNISNNNNLYTSSAQPTASAVFVSAPNDEAQTRSSAFSASAYPEGITENTGLGAGEEAPPMVGCTLVPDPNDPTIGQEQSSRISAGSGQTYVSPNSLPLNPMAPTSSYVSPSDIQEARASLDRQYR